MSYMQQGHKLRFLLLIEILNWKSWEKKKDLKSGRYLSMVSVWGSRWTFACSFRVVSEISTSALEIDVAVSSTSISSSVGHILVSRVVKKKSSSSLRKNYFWSSGFPNVILKKSDFSLPAPNWKNDQQLAKCLRKNSSPQRPVLMPRDSH